MDTSVVFSFLQESIFFILVFAAFLGYAMIRSTQSLINLILGLYFALLISKVFPYYDLLLGGAGDTARTKALIMIAVFSVFTFVATLVFAHLMPTDSTEPPFVYFGKKLLFALAATILVMVYSYNVLPVTELFTPGSPIAYLFAPADNFFWWLLVPLVALFLL